MPPQPEFDVFLAHNSEDKPQVREIAKRLKEYSVNYWIDEEQIPPGRPFDELIQMGISKSKTAAIFFGVAGLGDWQVWELKAIMNRCMKEKIPVIPVLLPGVLNLPSELLFVQQLSWVRFANAIDDAEALYNLEWGIRGLPPVRSKSHQSQTIGDDIILHVALNSNEMNQGTEKKVALENGDITVKIPPGVSANQRIRVKGKGKLNSLTQHRGDLYLKVKLVPTHEDTSRWVIDYTRLQNLLAAGQWQRANEVTKTIILRICEREADGDGWLRSQDIKKFPCQDVHTIDRLWMDYSKNRFGFSIQNAIWKSVGGTKNSDYAIKRRFGAEVGWYLEPGDFGLLGLADKWVTEDDIEGKLNSIKGDINLLPQGYLPFISWGYIARTVIGESDFLNISELFTTNVTFGVFYSHIESCKG